MAPALTPREKEILLMVLSELSSVDIARQLELSVRTVETHRKNIYRKTYTTNLVGLVKYSIRQGMISDFHYTVPMETSETVVMRTLKYAM